jgi:hypothetical protein
MASIADEKNGLALLSPHPTKAGFWCSRVVTATVCEFGLVGADQVRKMGSSLDTVAMKEFTHAAMSAFTQNFPCEFTCRDCEAISQAPAPFHATPRGWAGPGLLAMILFEKFGQHQPLNRQAERYAREACRLACRPWPTRSAPALRR